MKKYRIVEVDEITITKVILAKNEKEALEKFEEKVCKIALPKGLEWGNTYGVTDIEEVKQKEV